MVWFHSGFDHRVVHERTYVEDDPRRSSWFETLDADVVLVSGFQIRQVSVSTSCSHFPSYAPCCNIDRALRILVDLFLDYYERGVRFTMYAEFNINFIIYCHGIPRL